MEKGVHFRVLTDKIIIKKAAPKFLQRLQTNSLFENRYANFPIQIKMTIADEQKINLCISTVDNRGLPNMWSNNPKFAELARGCFEEMWKEAKAYPT